MPDDIVPVGLLIRRDLDVWGSGFRRAFPLSDTMDFATLLARIDEVDPGRKGAGSGVA